MTKVLIAEDEPYTRDLLVDTLAYAGYDVIQADNGSIALGLAFDEHPDLILLDLIMPVMDGFEVLSKLRTSQIEFPSVANIPVILLSGLAPEEGEQAAMSLGATHYLTKPWEPGMLETAVKVALREARALDDRAEQGRVPTESSAKQVVKQGNMGLADNLGVHGPFGGLTLIEGTSSSGKSVLSQHLVYGSLLDGNSVAMFASETSPQSLINQMASLGLDVSDYLRAGKLRIYPLPAPASGENPEHLLAVLAQDIARLPGQFNFIVVDAITRLACSCQNRAIMDFIFSCKRLCEGKRTIALAAHSRALDEKVLDCVRDICDSHAILRLEQVANKQWSTLEICKAPNGDLAAGNILRFQVIPELGIQIVPFHRVKV